MAQASLPARIVAAVVFLLPAVRVIQKRSPQQDNGYVVGAARALLSGRSPYADERFLYLPSSAVAAISEARLDDHTIRLVFPFVLTALTLSAWWFAIRLCGARPGSRLGLLGMAGIALLFGYRSLLVVGNWSVVAVLALPVALLLCSRDRWRSAAVVTGVSIALKPMLVPLALLFLFARKRGAFGMLVVVPLVLVLLCLPLTPEPGRFVFDTLPFLLHGQDEYAKPYDASLASILPRLGAGDHVTLALRGMVAVAGLTLAWSRWRLPDKPVAPELGTQRIPLRLIETACMIMLTVFLVFTPSFGHYSLVILLPLAATAVDPRSVARSPWFWIALAPQFPGVDIPGLATSQTRAFTVFFLFVVLTLLFATRTLGDQRSRRPGDGLDQLVTSAVRRSRGLGGAGEPAP
jgi:arabinofuranan 3-O-arabinosyltransferase